MKFLENNSRSFADLVKKLSDFSELERAAT